jgi:hypothetical protein
MSFFFTFLFSPTYTTTTHTKTQLGYPIVDGTSWTSWEVEEQVAGYVEKFEGYSFATVHGAGHEVPAYKPAQALKLIEAYFNSSSWLM